MPLIHRFDQTKFSDRKAKVQAAKDAIANLNNIIGSVEGANIAQSQAAIKNVAQHQKALIRIIVNGVV